MKKELLSCCSTMPAHFSMLEFTQMILTLLQMPFFFLKVWITPVIVKIRHHEIFSFRKYFLISSLLWYIVIFVSFLGFLCLFEFKCISLDFVHNWDFFFFCFIFYIYIACSFVLRWTCTTGPKLLFKQNYRKWFKSCM